MGKRIGAFEKSFFYLFSGNSISQLLPLAFAPVIARMYTREEMGGLAHYTAIVGVIAIVAAARYEFALVLPKKDSDAKSILAICLFLLLIVTVLSTLLLLFGSEIYQWYQNQDLVELIQYSFVGVAVLGLNSIMTQLSIRTKKFKSISVSKLMVSVGINGLTVAFGYMNFGVSGLIVAWVLGYFIGLLPLLWVNRKWLSLRSVKRAEMKILAVEHKSFPLINSLHSFSDKLFSEYILFNMIGALFGNQFLGDYFQMNRYLRRPVSVVGSSVGQVFYKEAADLHGEGKNVKSAFFKSIKITLIFAIPVSLLLFFFGEWMFVLYLGEEWKVVGTCAEIMSVPIFFNFISSPLSTIQLVFKKQFVAFVMALVAYGVLALSLLFGYYYTHSFIDSIKIYAFFQTVYYVCLLFWYHSLISKEK